MSSRPLTPPCVPFGTRRFNHMHRPRLTSRLSALYASAYSLCSTLSLCRQPPFPAYSVFIIPTSFSRLLGTYDCSVLSERFSLGTMTSADFLQFVVTTDFSACKTSSGKRNHFHLIYLLHLHLETRAVSDFVLICKLVHFKVPLYAVSVRQTEVLPAGTLLSPHIRLLSDSASRRTPLSSANSSYCQACSGLSPPSYYACRAHIIKNC